MDLTDELSLPEYRSQRRAAGKLIKLAEMDLAEAQTEDEHSRCRGEFSKFRAAGETISRKIASQ